MPESNSSVDVFLFDVDGVVTDEAAVVNDVVVRQILMHAVQGSPVAFITGRSADWLEKSLRPAVSRLASEVGEHWLSNITWAGEMGCIRRRGFADWEINWAYAVPAHLRTRLEDLTRSPKYALHLEWDTTKQVIATAEALHSPGDPEHLRQTREALAEWLVEADTLATPFGFRAQMSTYAVDVLSTGLTKRGGVEFALANAAVGLERAQIRVFGDSPGDVVLAEAAIATGYKNVTFYWLGSGPAPAWEEFPVVTPTRPHAEGTKLLLNAMALQTLARNGGAGASRHRL